MIRNNNKILSALFVFLSLFATAKKRENNLEYYLLDNQKTDNPLVVVCPGGGYFWMAKNVEGKEVAKWLNANGFSAVVLTYRVYPNRHPMMIEDMQKAIYKVRSNAKALNVDPDKIGVMGFSAGGHLVGMSMIFSDKSFIGEHKGVSLRPDFAAMIYPVVTMSEEFMHQGSQKNLIGRNPSSQMCEELSIEKNVHSNMPPVFIAHSKKDPVVDYRNSVVLADSLEDKGCDYALFLYESGTHGFGVKRKEGMEALEWTNEFLNWYNTINENNKLYSKD